MGTSWPSWTLVLDKETSSTQRHAESSAHKLGLCEPTAWTASIALTWFRVFSHAISPTSNSISSVYHPNLRKAILLRSSRPMKWRTHSAMLGLIMQMPFQFFTQAHQHWRLISQGQAKELKRVQLTMASIQWFDITSITSPMATTKTASTFARKD